VSGRGELMAAVLTMLRISINDDNREVEPQLKREWLDAVARHPEEILAIARLLDGHGFEDAIEALVVAFAETVAPLANRAPSRVRELLARLQGTDTHGTPRDRLDAWAKRLELDAFHWLLEVADTLPEEYLPSEGDDEEDVVEPGPPVTTDREARLRAECARAAVAGTLAADRAALTELYVTYRMHDTYEVAIALQAGVRLGLKAPAISEGATLHGSVVLRVRLSTSPVDLPMDSWIDRDHDGLWLAILVAKSASFAGFLRSCEFAVGAARGP
jgi:hypothetical protein